MKNSFLIRMPAIGYAIVLIFTVTVPSTGQVLEAGPGLSHAKAVKTLQQIIPDVRQVAWYAVENIHEAVFTMSDQKIRCLFNKRGVWLSTLIDKPAAYLPFEVQSSLRKQYREYIPSFVTERIGPDEHTYYVLLKRIQGRNISWLRIKTDPNGENILVIQDLSQTL